MALAKIKLDEVDTKATPVLADSVLISDSADDGRGKLVTGTALKDAMSANLVTTDGDQTITGAKTFRAPNLYYGPAEAANHDAFKLGCGSTPFWRFKQYTGGNLVIQCKPTESSTWQNALLFNFQSGGTIPYVQLYNSAVCVTQPNGDNSTKIATTAFVQAQKASPALTGTPTAPTATAGTNTTQIATTAFVQTAIDNAIYDLPVTRTGSVSSGTDKIILETSDAINAAWYDTTHVLNVSFFARNDSGVSDNTTFKFQLYDEDTSTAYTIASITADTLYFNLLQASIYRASSSSVNCNIQYGSASSAGYVSLASGSYKLRVVCTSTKATVFAAAQVRFTK